MDKIRTRSEIPVEDTWATEDMYSCDAAWEQELATLEQDKEVLASFAGKLSQSGKTLFDYLFCKKGARRIYAYTEDYNLSSQHLCEKLGMRREGLFVEFVSFVNDENGEPIYENTMQYAILKNEWIEKNANRF